MCLLWRPSRSLFKMALGISALSGTTDTSCICITATNSWSTIICSTLLHHLERKRKELRNQEKEERMDILGKKKTQQQNNGEKHKAKTTSKPLAKVRFLVHIGTVLCIKKTCTTSSVCSPSWRWQKACCSTCDRGPLIADQRLAHRLQKKITASHAQPKSASLICLFTSLLVQERNWRPTTALKVFPST